MKDGWLIIPNWERWQSRRDRHDPWIKSYADQLDRDEYLSLTLAERGLLADIRHAYSRHNGQLRAKILPGYIHARVRIDQLQRLKDAGYIDVVAAKPPPLGGASAARAREEVEVDRDTPYPAERGNVLNENGTPRERGENPRALGTNPRAVAKRTLPERQARRWIENGLAREVPDAHLEEVIADEFSIREPELVAELASYARERARQ